MKTKQGDNLKVDEIILQAEESGEKEKMRSFNNINSDESVKKIGDKISLVLVLVLLLLSIIQSVELFNLRGQILKGQFTSGAPAAPAAGSDQGLPAQQGGC